MNYETAYNELREAIGTLAGEYEAAAEDDMSSTEIVAFSAYGEFVDALLELLSKPEPEQVATAVA